MQIASQFKKFLSSEEIDKVIEVATDLGIEANWLLAVMYFETAYTFNPAKKNSIGSVGLIQFTRDKAGVNYKTIGGAKFYLEDIAKMSFTEQMDLVKAYYKEAVGNKKITSFIDTYLVTFFPAALGKSDDFILQTSGLSASLIAKQNPIFDRNKDSQITKKEVTDYFRQVYEQKGFDFDNDINLKGVAKTVVLGVVVFFYTLVTVFI